MRVLYAITLLVALVLPTVAFAEVQTFTATHTYILGDHDSKDDARQRCLLEAKRKVLEQAGVYIESASEVKNFDLTKDKITSFAAAPAHAECARVLWYRVTELQERLTEWALVEATDPDLKTTTRPTFVLVQDKNSLKAKRIHAYRCLPDTIDPRGPKGK